MTSITAVLPAFNEEISIGSIVLQTRKYTDRVIVVDDGSWDRTSYIAEMAGAEVIKHGDNRGKGSAFKTGFEAAREKDSDIIVTLDTDGQHDPSEIPKLTEPIISGEADMVNGSRYINSTDENTPAYRRVGQNVLDKATQLNSGISVTDSQSGFRAFASSTVDVFRFNASNMAIESEMIADAANSGLRIKEVEIGVRYDVDCSTEHPVKHGVSVLLKVLQDMEFNRPLYYFTMPGLIIGAVGLYMGLDFLQTFYHGGNLYFGPTILMVVLTLIGTFMAFTGIMLHSMSKLLRESKRV